MRRLFLLSLLSFAAVAAPAHAGLLPSACPAAPVSQPFLPWLDVMSYTPAPDGGLEAGASGWTLRGASVVDGNEPWNVAGAADSRSLSLPAGASATTPAMCSGLDRPTVRLFARRTSGRLTQLKVEVVSAGIDTVAVLPAGAAWQPTAPLPILTGLLPSLSGEQATVAFRFTALGGGVQIDDVYVDPYGRY